MKISETLFKAAEVLADVYTNPIEACKKYSKFAEEVDGYMAPYLIGCCMAIYIASSKQCEGCSAGDYFDSLYREDAGWLTFYWGNPSMKNFEQRMFALLFAAECAKSEGL